MSAIKFQSLSKSTETRGLELVQKLNELPSHEAESILNQMEALIADKLKPRQYKRKNQKRNF